MWDAGFGYSPETEYEVPIWEMYLSPAEFYKVKDKEYFQALLEEVYIEDVIAGNNFETHYDNSYVKYAQGFLPFYSNSDNEDEICTIKEWFLGQSINEAINAGKKISFLYFKYDVRKEPKLRNDGKPWIFSPHKLVWNGDFYYMVGVFDSKRVGTFRLDQILKRPDILEEAALPFPVDFDFEKHLQISVSRRM